MNTVLVVDDEPIVRDVIVRYLKRDGFTTLEAGDGDRARELIETADPSIVIVAVESVIAVAVTWNDPVSPLTGINSTS